MFFCSAGKKVFSFAALALLSSLLCAQTIVTANEFFQTVSEKYGSLRDFEATMNMTVNGENMAARMSFKRPNLLRMDFSQPSEQTIVFNGELLTIYLPRQNAILNQTVSSGSGTGGLSLATPQGLVLMSRYYSVAYEFGPDPITTDSGESAISLILTRRARSESFRTIKLLVSPDTRLIQKIEGTTTDGKLQTYVFSNYSLNPGIPDMRFVYDAPASANNYNDFLSTN